MIQGNSVPAPGSFSIFPGIPNPVRGAAGLLQGAVGVLSGCAGGAVTVAPYSLIGSGMSVVKGLNAMCALVGLEGEVQHAKDTNAQGIVSSFSLLQHLRFVYLLSLQFSGGVGALWGMRCSILSDAIKVTSLVQDIVMLPLRFAAGLQPLGQKANVVVDMLTDENVGLADIHREIISKNINNLTKLTLVATVGSGGLMVACFLVSAIALVLGLVMIPVLWSLLTLLVLGLFKSKRSPRSPPVLRSQPLPSPTQAPDLSPNATRSSFL